MDQRVRKLTIYLGGGGQAAVEALVVADLDSPRKLRLASDEEILAVPGVGEAKLAAIRARLGQ